MELLKLRRFFCGSVYIQDQAAISVQFDLDVHPSQKLFNPVSHNPDF